MSSTIRTLIISNRSQGQIIQRGAAAMADNSIREVTRDRSEGAGWTVGRVIARARRSPRSVQAVYDAANS